MTRRALRRSIWKWQRARLTKSSAGRGSNRDSQRPESEAEALSTTVVVFNQEVHSKHLLKFLKKYEHAWGPQH